MKKKLICSDKCRFCEIFKSKEQLGKIDTPIIKYEKYIAIVSLGAFIPGWTLIIPKGHIFSMKEAYFDLDFIDIANEMLVKLNKVYNSKCIILEHGANHEGSITACGTNHAHLHILPYDKSLLFDMKQDGKEWIECKIVDVKKIVGDNEYWLYGENIDEIQNANVFLHIISNPESQYFRKILAKKEGFLKQYDYKKYDFLEIAEETYEKLRGK